MCQLKVFPLFYQNYMLYFALWMKRTSRSRPPIQTLGDKHAHHFLWDSGQVSACHPERSEAGQPGYPSSPLTGHVLSPIVYLPPGLFGVPVLPQKLATQSLQGFHGMGAKMPYLRSHMRHLEPIHQSEHPSIEGSQCLGSTAHAYLTGIFPKGDITTIM